MKVLLDENFPLQLHRSLLQAGFPTEHLIALGRRGIADAEIRARLAAEELVFLTHDTEFEDVPANLRSQVIISRVPQRLPIGERVEVWLRALERFFQRRPAERLFEILPTGEIVAWEIRRTTRALLTRAGRPGFMTWALT